MFTLLAFLFVFGVLVFVHELGHFLVAKACGVGVYTFSVGYGRKVWGFTRNGTEYRLSWFPLGGFVRMVGQSDTLEEDERDKEMPPEAHFYNHPLWHRFLIVAAGPAMNLLFAFLIAPAMFWIGIEEETWRQEAPVVGYVQPDSAAWVAGLRTGDTVTRVHGDAVETWLDVLVLGQLQQGATIDLEARQDDGTLLRWQQEVRETDYLPDVFPFYYPMPAVVGTLLPGGAAADAGLQPGDRIEAIHGVAVSEFPEIGPLVQAAEGAPVAVVVTRGTESLTLELQARHDAESGRWLIGIGRREQMVVERYGFVDGIRQGVHRAAELIVFSVDIIWRMVSGGLGLQTLGGPIMIAQAAGSAAAQGVEYLISLMMFISIQLGLMNLLPIPVLDGGHLLLFTIEGVTRRKPSATVVEWASRFGLVFLLTIMLIATANDVYRFILPWFKTMFGGG